MKKFNSLLIAALIGYSTIVFALPIEDIQSLDQIQRNENFTQKNDQEAEKRQQESRQINERNQQETRHANEIAKLQKSQRQEREALSNSHQAKINSLTAYHNAAKDASVKKTIQLKLDNAKNEKDKDLSDLKEEHQRQTTKLKNQQAEEKLKMSEKHNSEKTEQEKQHRIAQNNLKYAHQQQSSFANENSGESIEMQNLNEQNKDVGFQQPSTDSEKAKSNIEARIKTYNNKVTKIKKFFSDLWENTMKIFRGTPEQKEALTAAKNKAVTYIQGRAALKFLDISDNATMEDVETIAAKKIVKTESNKELIQNAVRAIKKMKKLDMDQLFSSDIPSIKKIISPTQLDELDKFFTDSEEPTTEVTTARPFQSEGALRKAWIQFRDTDWPQSYTKKGWDLFINKFNKIMESIKNSLGISAEVKKEYETKLSKYKNERERQATATRQSKDKEIFHDEVNNGINKGDEQETLTQDATKSEKKENDTVGTEEPTTGITDTTEAQDLSKKAEAAATTPKKAEDFWAKILNAFKNFKTKEGRQKLMKSMKNFWKALISNDTYWGKEMVQKQQSILITRADVDFSQATTIEKADKLYKDKGDDLLNAQIEILNRLQKSVKSYVKEQKILNPNFELSERQKDANYKQEARAIKPYTDAQSRMNRDYIQAKKRIEASYGITISTPSPEYTPPPLAELLKESSSNHQTLNTNLFDGMIIKQTRSRSQTRSHSQTRTNSLGSEFDNL